MGTRDEERNPRMASDDGGGSGNGGGRGLLLLVWEVSADQEEPWRRFLQELSDARREDEEEKEYVESRKRLGISAESV